MGRSNHLPFYPHDRASSSPRSSLSLVLAIGTIFLLYQASKALYYGVPASLTLKEQTAVGHAKHDILDGETMFNWEAIAPSRRLEYHACYDKYQCARLLLPMDWTATDEETLWKHTVAIALIKLPADVSILDESYGGEVYFNPGKMQQSSL